jgi:hypothetical protein
MKRWNHFYISINKCRQVYFLSTSASLLQIVCVKYFSANKSKLMYYETEIKLSWHMHAYAHIPSMINVWIKYDEPRLYGNRETDLIMKTWHKLKSIDPQNEDKVRWHMPGWHVHTMINVWTRYGEPRLYDNGLTDLITKNFTLLKAVTRKAIPISHLQQLLLLARQKQSIFTSNIIIVSFNIL